MNKRLAILIIILILLLVGGGLWWWMRPTAAPNPGPTTNDPSQTFPVPPPITASSTDPSLAVGLPVGSPTANEPIDSSSANQPNPRLIPLSARAVVGAAVIPAINASSSDQIIFLERETGLIVEVNLASREKKELARVPVRAFINEAVLDFNLKSKKLSVWFSTTSGDERNFFQSSLTLNPASSTIINLPEMAPEPMGPNTRGFALSPTHDQWFTIEQVGEETIGKIFDVKNPKGRLVFESKINQWLVSWPEKNSIVLTTKPSNRATGYLYLLNPRNNPNTEQKIIGGLNGLTTLISPDGQKVLYAKSVAPNLELGLYHRQKNETRILAMATLPQKCVWVTDSTAIYCAVPRTFPLATYPDDYLAGQVSTDDLLWRIEAKDGTARLIWSDEPGLGDTANLVLAQQNQKVIFTNRLTNQLYLIDPAIGVASQPIP